MVGERIDSFLEKMQVALQEYQDGKNIREVLFSDNPGFIPKPSGTRVIPPAQRIRPIVTPPPVAPRVRTTPPTVIEVPIYRRTTLAQTGVVTRATTPVQTPIRTITPVQTRVATARAPATDFFSTLARGFARVTGAETQPPAGTRWLY